MAQISMSSFAQPDQHHCCSLLIYCKNVLLPNPTTVCIFHVFTVFVQPGYTLKYYFILQILGNQHTLYCSFLNLNLGKSNIIIIEKHLQQMKMLRVQNLFRKLPQSDFYLTMLVKVCLSEIREARQYNN